MIHYTVISQNLKTTFQDIDTNKIISIGDEIEVKYWTSNKATYKIVVDEIKNNTNASHVFLLVK